MKYRIKILRKEDWDVTDPTYCIEDGDIIELEPINEPKCACGLKECICSPMRTMEDAYTYIKKALENMKDNK